MWRLFIFGSLHQATTGEDIEVLMVDVVICGMCRSLKLLQLPIGMSVQQIEFPVRMYYHYRATVLLFAGVVWNRLVSDRGQ
jgi:hypothetical protein